MIEEPYRWVEAVANRREYIETQLAGGSPIAAVSCNGGILFVTVGATRQKVFEIYDRIAMGAIGHPGDIERLRMAAIELASTEGFTRSAADVSLRRLAYYSLSPLLKGAFEQIYGAPYLARMLFAEIADKPEGDLYLRIEYDGAISSSGGAAARARQSFSALSGTQVSTELMESYLAKEHDPKATWPRAFRLALEAWTLGKMALGENGIRELPTKEAIASARREELLTREVEAAILERDSGRAIRYRAFTEDEINTAAAD